MGQFGQELRRERELRGVALESITGVTKISARHLQALEEEHFDNLPGGVLSKGIVRGYARVVGLDEDAWVNRYLAAYHGSGQIKDDDAAWIEFAENVGRARKGDLRPSGNTARWAGVLALFMLLLLFGWYVAHFVSGRDALAQDELRPPAMLAPAAQLETGSASRSLSPSPIRTQTEALSTRRAGESAAEPSTLNRTAISPEAIQAESAAPDHRLASAAGARRQPGASPPRMDAGNSDFVGTLTEPAQPSSPAPQR